MGRLIDADAFLRKMNLAIVMMKHAMTDLDCEDDPELVMELKAYQDIRQGIKDEPTVEPEQKWIPCNERLPENGRQVLVYARSTHFALAKYDEMREADGSYKKQWVTFDAWKPFYTVKNVIAWCELPEPYREEGEK